jgi:hypothetical protein
MDRKSDFFKVRGVFAFLVNCKYHGQRRICLMYAVGKGEAEKTGDFVLTALLYRC